MNRLKLFNHNTAVCIKLDIILCIIEQFEAQQEELSRRREECIQLRTVLASQGKRMGDIANESYQGDPFVINEDGELQMAYKTQKELNKYVCSSLIIINEIFMSSACQNDM